ncbi:MAG: undecaprenyl/decaprenyl-phosphate alpha-N-acetylglucosaminyl 1-phosphate transferase [Bacteroidetes bacterium]|nr:undecaprenyl/decaprenyl-phosphate alpha-N-acetylglucosaminyl 1-phosphate transferase [Bacteroidota bacterium]
MTLIILAAVFLSVVVITPFGIAYARKTGKLDKPSIRKIHKEPTPSIGGHVFVPAAFVGWWLLVPEIDSKVLSLIASAAILYVMGIIDDARSLSHKIKLPIQVAASTLVIYVWDLLPLNFGGAFGIHLVHSWWGWILMLAFFQFTINAINYTDGINGLLGGYTVVTFGFLAWFTQSGDYPHMSHLLVTMLVAIVGFLIYNFRPQAKTFMGDTGSTVIGLIAAMTTARIIGKQPSIDLGTQSIPTFFMLVAVFWYPLFDSLQVYIHRISRGNSPFVADRSHLHHHLMAWTDKNHVLSSGIIIGITLLGVFVAQLF